MRPCPPWPCACPSGRCVDLVPRRDMRRIPLMAPLKSCDVLLSLDTMRAPPESLFEGGVLARGLAGGAATEVSCVTDAWPAA